MNTLLELNQLSSRHPTPKHGMISQMAAIQGHDTYARLPNIAAPTLVVTGKEGWAWFRRKIRSPWLSVFPTPT